MKHLAALLTAALLLTGCTTTPVPGPEPTPTPAPPTPPPPPAPSGSFTLGVPAGLTLQVGASAQITPTVQRNNYTASVTLEAAASPGLSVSRSGDTFTVTAQSAGTYVLTFTARGADGQVKTASVSVTVTAAQKAAFIPATGAAVGSGDGTKEGTVYVSPSAQEVEVLQLVNEVRAKGTLYGAPATAGSCVSGTWTPRAALTYNGLFAYAARKHAEYVSNVGYEVHNETQTASAFFYGAVPRDRVVRAYRELAGLTKSYTGENNLYDGGELVGSGVEWNTARYMVNWWLQSPGHCAALMDPTVRQMGSGYAYAPVDLATNRWGHGWALIVGK